MRIVVRALLCLLIVVPMAAQAWWNKDWTERAKIVLNTSATGVEIKEAVSNVPVAVRLHSGNFDFASAKEDGSDLRLMAGDDKTPLKFHIERFDSINELAVVWVHVPTLAPGSDKNVVYAYYGNANATADINAIGMYDASNLAVFHFGEKDLPAVDAVSGTLKTTTSVSVEPNGLLGNAATINGTSLALPASERLKFAAGSALTVSAWLKPTDVAKGAIYQQGKIQLALAGGKLAAKVDAVELSGGDVKAGGWQNVALTIGAGKATLFVDGEQVAQADAPMAETTGEAKIGDDYIGLLDELDIANVARAPSFLKVSAVAQGAENKLLVITKEDAGDEASGSGGPNYFGILLSNLTPDAWAVIIILMCMFVVAAWVMIAKTGLLGKVDKGNRAFLSRFRDASDAELLNVGESAELANASLFRLYQAGVREINKRFASRASLGAMGSQILSGASIDAIKASIDADLVRENHKLNSQMVLLTIAISGGPFLGLLGTVVGVMITFAAIAAAGDVNVNAIAPGIAAALLATVAGLGVAIPALFGYNWLASRIKNISSDMQIFVNEFVTRVAEKFGD